MFEAKEIFVETKYSEDICSGFPETKVCGIFNWPWPGFKRGSHFLVGTQQGIWHIGNC